jgi:cell division protein FtsB
VSTTAEFEAEWRRSRPSKLPWILLVAAVVVAGWSSCTLKGAKDEAENALKKESERSAALENKVKELAKTQAGLELKIRDLEREKALLAERKVEPVKVEDPKAAAKKPAATPAKSTTTAKKTTTTKKKK